LEYLDTFKDLRNTQRKVLLEQSHVIALYDGAPEIKPKCRMICFTSYDVSFAEKTTVLIGKNGTGKITSNRYADADSGCFTVRLRAMSTNNCDSSISDTVCLPGYWNGLYVPNAFTPDLGTGGPNEFLPIGIELKQYHIKVFSQWGILVWESTSLDASGRPNEAWKGYDLNNNPCPQGVYIWVVSEAVFTNNKPWEGMNDGTRKNYGLQSKPGNVTLIR
jgi:hypothetical protein